MSQKSSVALTGFADPVHDAQAAFRTLMQALAEPAQLVPFAPALGRCGEMLPALCALVMTLADYDTPLWLDPALRADERVLTFIRFRTGAPIMTDPSRAAIALVTDVSSMPKLCDFQQGTAEYPDRSTTVFLQVGHMSGQNLRAKGPGLKTQASFGFSPAPADFVEQWRVNHDGFPMGVDVVLVSPEGVVGLPRSLSIEGA